MTEQTFTIGRDVEFDILLQDADGNAIDPTGMSFRLRIYPRGGQGVDPVVDVASGTGISVAASPARLQVSAGAMPGEDPSYGTVDLTRTDTGADLWEAWPCRIMRAGSPRGDYTGDIVIRNGPDIVLRITGGTPGIQGLQGIPGASTLVSGVAPFFPNGNFALWGKGAGPFDASGIIAEGTRFNKGGGSSHAITRQAGITPGADYSLEWDRTVAGSVTSAISFAIEDIRRFHGKTFLFAFEVFSGVSIQAQTLLQINYGSGGSPTDTVLAVQAFTSGAAPSTVSRNVAIDLTGKTIGPGSFIDLTIRRTTAQANGGMRFGNLRGWLGTVDFGMPPIEPALRDQMARRRFQLINTRTINGTARVYFPVPMRAVPAVSASVGTISNITAESCDLTHASAANTMLTCDAEL
jgi:hypothetical protein